MVRDHKLIDSHCHLNMVLEKGLSEEETLLTMKENNIEGFVQISTDPGSIQFAKSMSKKNLPFLYAYTIGHHPNEVNQEDHSIGINEARCSQNDFNFVAIGEIGLDYYYTVRHQKDQIAVFEEYLQLASDLDKPVCIHTRDAHDDTLSVLKNFQLDEKVLIHCFTGNRRQMNDFLDMNCFISFSGIVTFKNAQSIQEAASFCSEDRMLVETDAPFLAPAPFRGKTNQPGYVRYTLEFIAKLKKKEPYELAKLTYENTKAFYNLN